MIFRNKKSLALSPRRRDALEILNVGVEAVLAKAVLGRKVFLRGEILHYCGKKIDLQKFKKIFVVGVGKCSAATGLELRKILRHRISGGILLDVKTSPVPGFRVVSGTHPFPSQKNLRTTKQIINLLKRAGKDDLVVFLISGGSSALLCQPKNHKIAQEQALTKCLFRAGAGIKELNIVRKHLSLARGGFLAKYVYPAKVIAFVFSDVPGNDFQVIGSGPLSRDRSRLADAQNIIKKYDQNGCLKNLALALVETPKDRKYFKRVEIMLLASSEDSLKAMAKTAKLLGYKTRIASKALQGEARRVGQRIAKKIKPLPSRNVLLFAGETTVKVRGSGRGGRNLELSLAALSHIGPRELVISLASDGQDNSDFAGGICDIITLRKARRLRLSLSDFLDNNDSYNFFKKTGQYLKTGPTSTNVSDLIVALK